MGGGEKTNSSQLLKSIHNNNVFGEYSAAFTCLKPGKR